MLDPLISIILPTHNGEMHISESIQSIIDQTYSNWELIIVNDCSCDRTQDIVSNFSDCHSRIRVVNLLKNHKLPGALNIGFNLAKGKYFTWTSDDNVFNQNAIDVMCKYLECHNNIDLVYCDWISMDNHGNQLEIKHVKTADRLPYENVIGPCFLYKSEIHTQLSGYDENRFLAEDYDFWLRASGKYRLEPLNECLYRYRQHEKSLTSLRTKEIVSRSIDVILTWFDGLKEDKKSHFHEVMLHWGNRAYSTGMSQEGKMMLQKYWQLNNSKKLPAGYRSLYIDYYFGIYTGSIVRSIYATLRSAGIPLINKHRC